jgi:hypothetical protein
VAENIVRGLRPHGTVFLFDLSGPYDIHLMDRQLAPLEPEKWPQFRGVMEQFNQGLADGRYTVFDQEGLEKLWAPLDMRLVAYKSYQPASNAYQAFLQLGDSRSRNPGR